MTSDKSEETISLRLKLLESLRDEALQIKEESAVKMKNRYDKKVRPMEFDCDEEVLVYDSTLLKQWSRKLEERWLGPFKVIWKGTMGAYTVEDVNGKVRMVSGDQMKRYHRRS